MKVFLGNLSESVGVDRVEALIYTLPKSYLRPGATTFNEFKMDGKSQAQFKVFSFYMDIIQRMAEGESKQSSVVPGQDTYFLIEYLRNKMDKQAVVGYRFFFFSTRAKSNTWNHHAQAAVKDAITSFSLESKKRKNLRYLKMETNEKYECCKTITTADQYLLDICDQYLGNNECSNENNVHWLTSADKGEHGISHSHPLSYLA